MPARHSHRGLHLIEGEDSYLRRKIRGEIIEKLVPEEARAFAVQEFSLSRSGLDPRW